MSSGRKTCTLETKLQVLQRLGEEFSGSINSAAVATGIDRKRIREWRDQKEALNNSSEKKRNRQVAEGGAAAFPELEEKLLIWFEEQRTQKYSVNYKNIREQVSKYKEELGINDERFVCSDHWIFKFCQRHSVRSPRIIHHRKTYTLENKLQVLQRLEEEFGGNIYSAAKATGIDRKRIREWRGQKEALANSSDKKRKRQVGGGRTAAFPELEEKLFIWFEERRVQNCSVSYKHIREQALKYKAELGINDERFVCSDHWIFKFFQRHGVSSRRINHKGQQNNREKDIIQDVVKGHCDGVERLADHDIFNMDEMIFPQTLDVGVSEQFKVAICEEWKRCFDHGSKEFMPAGYSKEPSYEQILSFVGKAVQSVSTEIIHNSKKIANELRNGRPQAVLSYDATREGMTEAFDKLSNSESEYCTE